VPKDRNYSVFKTPPPPPPLPEPVQIGNTFVPWTSAVIYLGLLLDPTLLHTKRLRTVTNTGTGTLCNIFPLLTPHSHKPHTTLNAYKLLIPSLLTYAALSAMPHVIPTVSNSKPSKTRAYVLSEIISEELPSPFRTTPLILNSSETSSTNLRPNVLLTVHTILAPWSNKSEIRL
jgi:hypothetical protein